MTKQEKNNALYEDLSPDEKQVLWYASRLNDNDKKSLLNKMDGVLMALEMISEMLTVPAGEN